MTHPKLATLGAMTNAMAAAAAATEAIGRAFNAVREGGLPDEALAGLNDLTADLGRIQQRADALAEELGAPPPKPN